MTRLRGGAVMAVCLAAGLAGVQASEADDDPVFGNQYWTQSDCAPPPPGPAIHVAVSNIKSGTGNIRLVLYDDPNGFLKKGKRIARIDLPAQQGSMDICLPLPKAGTYALAVLHDEDADGGYDLFKEGFGFPNNPKILFSPPDFDEASFTVVEETVDLPITLKYLLSPPGRSRRPAGH